MLNEDEVLQSIYCAIDEVNLQLPQDRRLAKSPSTCIAGKSGGLDSLQLISLIVSVEQNLESTCHVAVSLSDKENIFSEENGPLETVQTLKRCICSLCDVESNV